MGNVSLEGLVGRVGLMGLEGLVGLIDGGLNIRYGVCESD